MGHYCQLDSKYHLWEESAWTCIPLLLDVGPRQVIYSFQAALSSSENEDNSSIYFYMCLKMKLNGIKIILIEPGE